MSLVLHVGETCEGCQVTTSGPGGPLCCAIGQDAVFSSRHAPMHIPRSGPTAPTAMPP